MQPPRNGPKGSQGHSYRGQAPARRKATSFSQASTRRPMTCIDQFGREYSTQVSLKTGEPTGLLHPEFTAPWYADHWCLRVNPENAAEVFVDLHALLVHRKAAMDAYHADALDNARKLKVAAPRYGDYDNDIVAVTGRPPKALQPIIAAIQGNAWILGETDVVDDRLLPWVKAPHATDDLLSQYDFRDPSDEDYESLRARNDEEAASFAADVAAQLGAPSPTTYEQTTDALADLDTAVTESGDDVDGLIDTLSDSLGDSLAETAEEEADPDALGGRVVPPQNVERVARQAPRRPTSTANRTKHGAQRSANHAAPRKSIAEMKAEQRDGRRSLADGAAPIIGSGGL